jgi:hypothetical protein
VLRYSNPALSFVKLFKKSQCFVWSIHLHKLLGAKVMVAVRVIGISSILHEYVKRSRMIDKDYTGIC